MKARRSACLLFMGLSVVLLVGCDDDPAGPVNGRVAVQVVDVGGSLVPDVEIRITPQGLSAMTDAEGLAVFELAPGSYFVDADVCCRGPGLIDYHVPVIVHAGETASVELEACLACV